MLEPARYLARAGGHRLAYRTVDGAGPGVVFLGGFRSDMNGTKAQALDEWCRNQRRSFVRFDYFGHGASSGEFGDGTVGRWRQDALAVTDQLTTGPQILIGSSLGGWLMLHVALARPQRIAGLIGIAAAVDFTEDLIHSRLTPSMRAELEQRGRTWLPSNYDTEPYPLTQRLLDEGREHLLLRREALAIDRPVRLLHGMDDPDVPWSTSIRISDRLVGTDVRIVLVKDGDHRLSRPQDLALLNNTLAELDTALM